jgi:hypothetical protein
MPARWFEQYNISEAGDQRAEVKSQRLGESDTSSQSVERTRIASVDKVCKVNETRFEFDEGPSMPDTMPDGDRIDTLEAPPESLSTQAILQALAADPDIGKLRAEHPGLTEEQVRESLRQAADWAARDYVEPRLSEKLLTAFLIPLLAAVAALSHRYMLPLVYGSDTQYREMDLGALPQLSIWFMEYHQRLGWLVVIIAFLALVYLSWACRRRWRMVFFRQAAGLLGGLYATWVILAVLLPIIVISARLSR